MDEEADPRAEWTSGDFGGAMVTRRDHWHLLGNDRTLALAYNHGHVELLSAEEGGAWVNAWDPDRNAYSGGFGYLRVGDTLLSTFFDDREGDAVFRRRFGTGYFEKEVRRREWEMRQTLYLPVGHDPVILSRLEIENEGAGDARASYFEYWGPHLQLVLGSESPEAGREHAAATYTIRTFYRRDVEALFAVHEGPEAPYRVVFLAPLGSSPAGIEMDATRFFGEGGRARPGGVVNGLAADPPRNGQGSPGSNAPCLAVQVDVELPARSARTLEFIFGYAPRMKDALELIEAYRRRADPFAETMEAWRAYVPSFEVPGEEWLDREMKWSAYSLRAAILSPAEGGRRAVSGFSSYQYFLGAGSYAGTRDVAGPLRDVSQYSMPFAFLDPEISREHLAVLSASVPQDPTLPWWHVGGLISPSDYALFFLWAGTEYVWATRDWGFLDVSLPFHDGGEGSFYDHLAAAYRHQDERVGTGASGLVRILGGDWNDGVALAAYLTEGADRNRVLEEGESTLNTAMAAYVYPRFAELVEARGDADLAAAIRERASALARALEGEWTGRWYTRAKLHGTSSVIQGDVFGDERMYLEPQPWAIVSGAAGEERGRSLLDNARRQLLEGEPCGARLVNEPVGHDVGGDPGEGADGGIWPLLNGHLVWAASRSDPSMAWDLFRRNTLACRAEAYPELWSGIWTSFDSYNSARSAHPGRTWEWWPMVDMNRMPATHPDPHFAPLYSLTKLVGISFDSRGLTIDPRLPFEPFRFATDLVSVTYGEEFMEGRYRPVAADRVQMRVRVSRSGPVRLRLESGHSTLMPADGFVGFEIDASPEAPAAWRLEW